MTSTKVDKETLTVLIRRTVKAPAAKAFAAWTEPEQMKKWFGCAAIDTIEVTQDFRVGGHYKVQSPSCSTGGSMSVHGTFKEIVQNKKVIYTWNNESAEVPARDTVVSVEFIDHGDTTEIILQHTKFAIEKTKEGHSVGWNQSFDKLEAFLAS